MRKFGLITGIVAITSMVALAPATQARSGGANADVKVYDNEIVLDTFALTFGQVFSSKSDCADGRKFKLIDKNGKKSKKIDSGKTSDEGAMSGGYLSNRIKGTLFFQLPATKGCAAAKGRIGEPAKPDDALPKDVDTIPLVADINGIMDDGAVAGILLLSDRAKCFSNRKMTLIGDGEVLDKGRSSDNSTFALHLTAEENQTIAQFTVKVAKSKTPSGETCRAGRTDFVSGT